MATTPLAWITTTTSSPGLPLFLLLLLFSNKVTIAQALVGGPQTVFAPASVFVDGQKLWVHGGADTSSSYNQFFTLDLSSSWPVDSPQINMLPPTANPNSHHTAALTRDGNDMVVFSRSSAITRCSLASAAWSTDMATSQFNDRYQLKAVTDPNSGSIYVPGGYGPSESMMIYSPGTKVATQDTANYLLHYIGYAAMWNSQRKSVMTFGGNILNTSSAIHEYVPGVGWDIVPYLGDAPISRSNACLVPAYNGTKAVLFGGYNNSTYYSDIYILDQAAMTWTKGPVGSFGGRAMSACAVSGDQFVSWGGYDGIDAIKDAVTVVFNLKTMQWQTKFVANPEAEGSNKGAIIGGVVGGLAGIALGVALYMLYRRKRAQLVPAPATAADAAATTGSGCGSGGGDGYDAVKMYDYNQLNLQQPQHVSTFYDPSQPPGGTYVPLAVYDPSGSPDPYHQQQHQAALQLADQQQPPPQIFQPAGSSLGYVQQQGGYDPGQVYVPPTATVDHGSGTAYTTPTLSTTTATASHPSSAADLMYKVPTESGQHPQGIVSTPPASSQQQLPGPQFIPPPGSTSV